ncbi:MAG: hypothetical protein ACKO3W_04410, partial [bacterium]
MDESTETSTNERVSTLKRAGGFSRISRDVLRIARRMRGMRMTGALTSVASLALFMIACCAALDAFVRFPWPLRVVMLGGIICVIVMKVRSRVWSALRFRPTPVEVALRIERMRPELSGRLASAVEFDLSGLAERSPLAARSLADAGERASGADLSRVVRYGPTARRVVVFLLILTGAIAFSLLHPEEASIAVRRIVTPWSDVSWPARTAIASLVEDGSVAARGRPFALRARLDRGDATTERVKASYRAIHERPSGQQASDRAKFGERADLGEWTDVVLSLQPSGEFERLIDATGDAVEVRFSTSDASTEIVRVRLVDPPTVESATLVAVPPKYARGMITERREELGDGTDARSVVRDPILEGSEVTVDVRLNRVVPFNDGHSTMRVVRTTSESASKERGVGEVVEASITASDVDDGGFDLEFDSADPKVLHLRGRADRSTRIELELVDENGIAQEDAVAFAFEVIPDREPTAVMVEPMQDESVLPDARVTVRAESRDDLALRSAGIEIAIRVGQSGTESLALEERAADFIEGQASSRREFIKTAETERLLDLTRLSVKAGDTVVLRGFAEDFLDRAASDEVQAKVDRSADSTNGSEGATKDAAAATPPTDGRRIRSAA